MRRFALGVALASCAVATVIACADSGEPDPVETADAASLDGASEARAPLTDGGNDADTSPPARDAAYDAADEPVVCAVTPCATQLAAGYAHVCAVLSDGTVRCWGLDVYGALGAGVNDAGTENDAGVGPVRVSGITDATQISAGGFTTCVRTASGSVKCWGANDHGQLGLEVDGGAPRVDGDPHPAATTAGITGAATRVDVGYDTVCAKLATGELSCWGSNEQRQLLRPDGGTVGAPGVLTSGTTPVHWSRTAFGSVTGYAITEDEKVMSWGFISGRNTNFPFDPEPRVLPPLEGVVALAAGPATLAMDTAFSHTCAIASGNVYCWGKSFEGDIPAFCTGVPNDQRVPALAQLHGTAFPQQVAVAHATTCVRLTDGTVECCGDDSHGQLGLGHVSENATVLAFTPAAGLTGHAVQVVTGETMTCALLSDGKVQCWGGNERGELGQRTVDAVAHPAPLTVSF